jgi:HEAT repeat protein
MKLYFCPRCRQPYPSIQQCSTCHLTANVEADTYTEKLLETVIAGESDRAGMAVDVLTKWMHEPRAVVPLVMLLERTHDPYSQVIGARGLGWLKAGPAVPALVELLLTEDQPYVSRVAAAEALGEIGGRKPFVRSNGPQPVRATTWRRQLHGRLKNFKEKNRIFNHDLSQHPFRQSRRSKRNGGAARVFY